MIVMVLQEGDIVRFTTLANTFHAVEFAVVINSFLAVDVEHILQSIRL